MKKISKIRGRFPAVRAKVIKGNGKMAEQLNKIFVSALTEQMIGTKNLMSARNQRKSVLKKYITLKKSVSLKADKS